MPKAPIRILIVAALCVLSLIGLVVRESMARASGTEVLLAMEAVDPRALLSGHYVIVALQERTTIPDQCRDFGEPDFTPSTSWIAIQQRQLLTEQARQSTASHGAVGRYQSREEALVASPIVARGSVWCTDPVLDGDVMTQLGTLRLDLGISRFHINQTDAERIDRLLRAQTSGAEQRIFAIVSIGEDGRARLKGLMVDGERLELNWL